MLICMKTMIAADKNPKPANSPTGSPKNLAKVTDRTHTHSIRINVSCHAVRGCQVLCRSLRIRCQSRGPFRMNGNHSQSSHTAALDILLFASLRLSVRTPAD